MTSARRRSRPATQRRPRFEGTQQAARVQKFDIGMYAFARAEGRVVAHNIFLNGNTFGDSTR
jgi:hypothetical protein